MTPEKIQELRSLKPDICGEASDFIEKIMCSPYYDGYMAVLTTINNLNEELMSGVSKINEGVQDDSKSFERSHKYITEMTPYYDQLDYFRGKMSPKEIAMIAQEGNSLLDEARINLKNKNGKDKV